MEVTRSGTGRLNAFGRLAAVAVKHVRDAFVDERTIAAQWRDLGFTAAPDLARALAEYEAFLEILRSAGGAVHLLPRDTETTLDSIYAHDASTLCPRGVVLCRMGKRQRAGEPAAHARAYDGMAGMALPVVGRIEPPGKLEGGDLVWFDDRTVAIGRGYRTNADGIRQFQALAGESVRIVEVPLPHWHGESDVMHLMSLISPVDSDLAVVYAPLLPVPFREWLLARGLRLIEVPDGEFASMGTNVLALGPRRCVLLAGNPLTRAALERAGAEVLEYDGTEISVKGSGGPTCLTRPLARE
jgi:N-dimethylarginine dimethylaminohydrolase